MNSSVSFSRRTLLLAAALAPWSRLALAQSSRRTNPEEGVPIEPIKIGVAGPVSGPLAIHGAEMFAGVDMVAAVLNQEGGMEGRLIEVLLADDEGDPATIEHVFKYLAENKVMAVIGHYHSSLSVAAAPLYAKAGILQISPSATARQFTDLNLWNVFRTAGREDALIQYAAFQMTQKYAGRKIALIHDGSARGRAEGDLIKASLNASGITETHYDLMPKDDARIRILTAKTRALEAEVVYFAGGAYEAGRLLYEMRSAGMLCQMMGAESLSSMAFWVAAGPGAEGTLVAVWGDPSYDNPSAPVHDRAKEKNIKASATMVRSYAALEALAAGARTIQSTDPKKIAERLRSGRPFDSVLGPQSFDAKGDIRNVRVELKRWQNGVLVPEVL